MLVDKSNVIRDNTTTSRRRMQVNVADNEHTFRYAVDWAKTGYVIDKDSCVFLHKPESGSTIYDNYGSDVTFFYKDYEESKEVTEVVRDTNVWTGDISGMENSRSYLPSDIKLADFRLLFPEYSADVYARTLYAVRFSVLINNRYINIGSFVIDRMDAKAVGEGPIKFKNTDYLECYSFNIVDPYEIMYSKEWEDFRNNVCGLGNVNIQNVTSVLHVEVAPVKKDAGQFILNAPFVCGSSDFPLCVSAENSLRLDLSFDEEMNFDAKIHYNDSYGGFAEYMWNIYGLDISGCKCVYDLVIKDDDNVYFHIGHDVPNIQELDVFKCWEFEINSWNEYVEGCHVVCSFVILTASDEELFYILSNKMPITPNVFKFLITSELVEDPVINLDDIADMTVNNINVTNTIKQEVVSIERPAGSTGMMMPVFVQAQPAGKIIIHPEVIENIPINLNAYKQRVNMFYLQVGGMVFPEIGRTHSAVIFKVSGPTLNLDDDSSTYYILDKDKNLVTTGNMEVRK